MLKVIVGVCKTEKLKKIAGESCMVITDAELYRMLNGEEKFGSLMYTEATIESLVDAIVETSKAKDIVIHTFNHALLNWFDDDVATHSFYFINVQGEHELFFSHQRLLTKLDFMGPGEAVCDTDLSKI